MRRRQRCRPAPNVSPRNDLGGGTALLSAVQCCQVCAATLCLLRHAALPAGWCCGRSSPGSCPSLGPTPGHWPAWSCTAAGERMAAGAGLVQQNRALPHWHEAGCPLPPPRTQPIPCRPEIPARDELPGPDSASFSGLDAYVQLIEACWAQDPAARPAFEHIVSVLK